MVGAGLAWRAGGSMRCEEDSVEVWKYILSNTQQQVSKMKTAPSTAVVVIVVAVCILDVEMFLSTYSNILLFIL